MNLIAISLKSVFSDWSPLIWPWILVSRRIELRKFDQKGKMISIVLQQMDLARLTWKSKQSAELTL